MFKLAPPPRAIKLALATAALALSALSLSAQATTVSSYTANNVNLVSVTWTAYGYSYSYTTTQDANLFKTMNASAGDKDSNGVNDLVEAILAVSPTVTDTYATANVSANDFVGNGKLTYFGSLAFVNYLNSISYAGNNQWYLPNYILTSNILTDAKDSLINIKDGATDFYRTSSPTIDQDSGEVVFYMFYLGQYGLDNEVDWRNASSPLYSIFLTNGLIADVSAVPAPAAAWLFATGLPVVGAFARRRKQQA